MATPSVTVTKTDSGWTVTKDSESWQITDKNKDGRFDSSDLVNALSGNKNSLSNDDMTEIWWQTVNLGAGATAGDIQRYNQYKEAQEAAKKKAAAASTASTTTQPAKKQGFWGKVGSFCQNLLPFIPLGLGVAGALTAWSTRGGGANDTALVLSNITNQVTTTMYTMTAMNALNNVKDYSVGNIGAGNMDYSGYLAALNGTAGISSGNVLDMLNGTTATTTTTTNATAAQKRAFMNNLSTLYDNDVNDKFANANGQWINENVLDDEDAEYDDETIKLAQQIKATPSVPVNCIKVDKNDTSATKLTKKEAGRIQNWINNYENLLAQGSDNAENFISKGNYDELKRIFKEMTSDSELSQKDYNFIQKLLTDNDFRAPRKSEE